MNNSKDILIENMMSFNIIQRKTFDIFQYN